MVEPIVIYKKTSRQATRDDVEGHEHLLQGRFLPPDYQQIFYNQF